MDYDKRQTHIKTEKARARELRKSHWWKNKIQDAAKCHYCSLSLQPEETTMDHVVPLSRGGKSTKGNIVISCKTCNTEKADCTPVEILFQKLETL